MNSKAEFGTLKSSNILICTHAYPPDPGGIAAFTRDIYQLLKNAGSTVNIFKPDTSNPSGKRLNSYLNIYKMAWELLKKIRKEKPDVIICSRLLPIGPLVLMWSVFFDYKVVFQVLGTELRHRFKAGWRKKVLSRIYNQADQIWSISEYTAGLLRDYGCNSQKIKVIYPFITRDAQALANRINGRESSDRFRIVTAAALYPRKGIDLVLRALARLENENWEYHIAGKPYSPMYQGVYQKLTKELGIEDKVKFLGQLDREKVWEEMAHADLFVMPSRGFEDDIESFGIVFIEAQQFGVPCIGTDVGGIKEAIGDGGIIIEDEDLDELTESIKYLIENKEIRERLSDSSLNRVEQNFLEQNRYNDLEEAIARLK